MRRILLFVLAIVLGLSTFSGCKKPRPDTESTLEIYIIDLGYGVDCIKAVGEAFAKEDWVKEKYPDLELLYVVNDQRSFGDSRIQAGAKNNTIDLFFNENGRNIATDANGESLYLDITESVFNQKVPGEDILYKNKMIKSFLKTNRYTEMASQTGKDRYYFALWGGGCSGIIYNEDILNELGLSVPRTTNELLEICAEVKALEGKSDVYGEGYTFIQSSDPYFDYLFPIWWAQYEGVDGYSDFWNGITDNYISKKIFEQQGRLCALEVFEEILDYDKGYITPTSLGGDYITQQTAFMKGNGIFHVNGDWFDNEMHDIGEQIKDTYGIDYTFKLMKTPIISSVIKMTPTIPDEETLLKVIDAVDAGAPEDSVAGVSVKDFRKIREARGVSYSISPNLTAIIPTYATGKEVAADFLLYMATDTAIEAYMEATEGASLPFRYDVKEKNPELYGRLSSLQQSRFDYIYSDDLEVEILPIAESFPLALYGGLTAFSLTSSYYSLFTTRGNTVTAQNMYDDTLTSWTDEKWQSALTRAGL